MGYSENHHERRSLPWNARLEELKLEEGRSSSRFAAEKNANLADFGRIVNCLGGKTPAERPFYYYRPVDLTKYTDTREVLPK
jgi:hypothetical protein